MSAPACLLFFGIRFDVGEEDFGPLENRSHPYIALARSHKLDWYWANFAGDDETYYLFVGKQLCVIGLEDQGETHWAHVSVVALMESVAATLALAGFHGHVALHCCGQPIAGLFTGRYGRVLGLLAVFSFEDAR